MAENDDTARLLTPDEVAARLGVSPNTLAHWRWRRIGPPFRYLLGRTVRYPEAELSLWLASDESHQAPDDQYVPSSRRAVG